MRRIDRAPTTLAAVGAIATLTLWGCATGTRSHVRPTAPAGSYALVDSKLVPVPPVPMGDAKTVNRIIRVGMNDNQTLAHMTELCETFGARLTGSTSCERAAQWARTTLSSWGLNRARLDWWGDIATRFDRRPSRGVAIIPTPDDPDRVVRELQFTTLSWTRGTNGPVRGPVVPMPTTGAEVSDRISGAWVLIPPDYANAGNIRRSGQLMRQRTDERHAIRRGVASTGEAPPPAEPAPDGVMRWTGSFSYGDSKLPLTLDLTRNDRGEFEGTQSIKDFHSGPISDARFDESTSTLTYTWRHSMGRSSIELRRDADTMTGASVSMTGERYPIEVSLRPEGVATPTPRSHASGGSVLERVLAMNPAGFISTSM
ncbi:MAG: hypothetical protein ACIARR_07710, partial [Phycisphaerales bacterium JB059]